MSTKHNVLIIMSDQHNRSVMGCAGDALARTPNLDRLASEGMQFTNAYTASPLCVPARTSFLTSKLPSRNRVWDNAHILNSGALTWLHRLPKAGYETALIGRMHFEGPDQSHGFQKTISLGPFAVHPGMYDAMRVYKDGVPSASGQNRSVMEVTGGKGKGPYEVIDERVTQSTCSYLQQKAEDGSDAKPFVAVTGFLLPHCPFIGDPEAFDYYYQRLPEPTVTQDYIDNLPEGVRRYLSARDLQTPLDPKRVRSCQAAYYAMIESMDRLVGQILDTLDDTGLAKNTLVVYVSDHGELLNTHGCWAKGCYYEGSAGIPLIARCPGLIPASSQCSSVVSLMDIGPTVLELANAECLPFADGISLLSSLAGESQHDEQPAFSELFDSRTGVGSAMVRSGPWKLWQFSDDSPDILFNLDLDPDEERNAVDDVDTQDILDALRSQLHNVINLESTVVQSQAMNIEYAGITEWAQFTRPILNETESVPLEIQSFEFV